MDGLQLENRTQVILWLRENYKHATTTSVSKRSVFAHYLDACKKQNVLTPISHTYFGKLVRKAFPDVRCNRKGPRGSAQQHYRLIRADGGDADEFLSALGDEHDDVHVDDDEEDEFAAKSASKRKAGSKKAAATTAAALRKNGVSRPSSRARAAATAAASTISRMINADQAPANLTEAWSFSSAPSSPSFSFGAQQGQQHHGAESIPSSPGAQSSSEYEQEELHQHQQLIEDVIEEEVLEEGHEEVFQQQHQNEEDLDEDDYEEDNEEEHVEEEQAEEEDEQDEEEDEQAEEEEVEEFNFDLPQFEITPGEESPGTSFSYEACPPLSGHDQNLRLQQQLLSSSSASSVQQSCFEPSAFYDFVSPDLEMPLSAINQVANLAEDFGWSMPSMPSAVDRCHMAAAAYGSQPAMMQQQQQPQQQRYAYQQPQQVLQQQQQQQSSGVLSFLLSEQVPATQCSDLAEWVAHYCI